MNGQLKPPAFLLEVDPDKEYASLVRVTADTPGSFNNLSGAREALRNANITFGIDTPRLQETCENLEEMEPGSRVVIARCKAPDAPLDGRVEIFVNVSGQAKYSGVENDAASVDFRSATSVTCVTRGTLLAKAFPPEQGRPGRDICGKVIPARPAKEVFIRAGLNVNFDAREKTFTATADGRPVFADRVLSVLPVYEVSGDVNYETGHINFIGSVVVAGNVLNDFNIKARDIEIGGTVGACKLTAKDNIIILGGINGNDRAVIKAGGSLSAKYINNCEVECLGDVTSTGGILNSRIMCNGKVRAGSLIGGITCARQGVAAGELGSELGIPTQVEPGVDLLVRKLDNLLALIDREIETLLNPYAVLLEDIKKYRTLSEERKEAVQADFAAFKKLMRKHLRLANRRKELIQNAGEEPRKEIIVLNTIHPDTVVRTKHCMRHFNKPLTGPVRLVENIAASIMEVKTYSQQEKAAAVLGKV